MRQDLTAEQIEKLRLFIEGQYANNVFILKDGEIEAYFPNGFKGKDLEKVLDLLKGDDYVKWKGEDGYKKLHKLLMMILTQNSLCS